MSDPSKAEIGVDDYVIWKGWQLGEEFGKCSEFERAYFEAEIAKLQPMVIADVLELGFGSGAFLGFARSNSWRVTGVEVIEPLIDAAREAGFETLRPDRIPSIPSSSLDLVVAFDVIEHIPQSELPALFTTIGDKLRPGGAFLARFPNGDSPFGLPYQNGDVTHVTVVGSGKLRNFAKRAGLIVEYCGATSRVLRTGYWRHSVQEVLSACVVASLEKFMRLVITPRSQVTFFSGNLLAILRRPNAIPPPRP